ncbi:hypothetical protein GOP47_0018271 [Adiantum capillus-veneris]|uniref:Uncharacterized protein n=1 Tax=Adiantum capillus-veneris TaxID=13818 RepID=A0A9D4UHY2_ADICA|nr:hypothetical protein GOP47_0018271 [Adiantum capillus-veneris]
MDSNEEKLLFGYGSFFTEDSFLLSDYLHRQAERASNRLFSSKNPLLFLRSKIFSSDFEQKEGEKILDRCCSPVLKSLAMGASALASAQKESSESYTGNQCSSHILSELEQQKRDSSSSLKFLASSDSCIDSSQCCESESAADAATRIDITKAEGLHKNFLCCESREAISMASSGTEDEEGAADEFLTTSKRDTEALDLLAIVAMRENDSNPCHDTALSPSRSPGSPIEFQSPAHGSNLTPILRKKVIRRAKSAFQRQLPNDAAKTSLKFCESVTRKENHVSEWCIQDQRRTPSRHQVHVAYAKRRKLQDLSAISCKNEDKDLEESCGMDKDQIIGSLNDAAYVADVGYNGVWPGLSPKLPPNPFSTTIPEMAFKHIENFGNAVNYRKLQISSRRLLGVCDAEHSSAALIEDRHARLATEASTANNCLSFEASKGVSKACLVTDLNSTSSLERDKGADFRAAASGDIKHGSSMVRLKILPIRQPSADLTLLQDASKLKGLEFSTEGGMVTRKRSAQQRMEKEGTRTSAMVFSPSMQQTEIQMVDAQISNTGMMVRTKRGRSQVLPTKFSDSVLQPWKSLRKKMRILNV